MALLPTQLPKRLKGVDVAAQFAPARELGGDFHDFLMPESNTLIVALGDVSGKGVPAALYSVFAGELVRGRTFRRRFMPERSTPAAVLSSINTILHERQLEEYYCTMCYAVFDMKKHVVTIANSALPYPVHVTGGEVSLIELPGLRRVGSDERRPGGIHPAAADGRGEGRPLPARQHHRPAHRVGGRRTPRRLPAQRRHDGGGDKDCRRVKSEVRSSKLEVRNC
jgi:hypothetical protein